MERDPVCGMMVEPAKAAAKMDYQGKTYYFCSMGCKNDFEKNPEQYLGGQQGGQGSQGSQGMMGNKPPHVG